MRKTEQPAWTRTANGANKRLVLHVRLRCDSLSNTTPVSLLANEFDVRSILHVQVSLTAVGQNLRNSWGYEWLQKSKDSSKNCFENVNIFSINTYFELSCFEVSISRLNSVIIPLFSSFFRCKIGYTGLRCEMLNQEFLLALLSEEFFG